MAIVCFPNCVADSGEIVYMVTNKIVDFGDTLYFRSYYITCLIRCKQTTRTISSIHFTVFYMRVFFYPPSFPLIIIPNTVLFLQSME